MTGYKPAKEAAGGRIKIRILKPNEKRIIGKRRKNKERLFRINKLNY